MNARAFYIFYGVDSRSENRLHTFAFFRIVLPTQVMELQVCKYTLQDFDLLAELTSQEVFFLLKGFLQASNVFGYLEKATVYSLVCCGRDLPRIKQSFQYLPLTLSRLQLRIDTLEQPGEIQPRPPIQTLCAVEINLFNMQICIEQYRRILCAAEWGKGGLKTSDHQL